MAKISHFPLLLFSLLAVTAAVALCKPTITLTSLYLSPKTLFPNYDKMLTSFRIYVYAPPPSFTGANSFSTPQESQFYTSLMSSPFVTLDSDEADLFFLPFPSSLPTRSIARLVRDIRSDFPFWNRTLGADHFYLSAGGVESLADRNIVELKKNAIQISCFPASSGSFTPHKDITLPPMNANQVNDTVANKRSKFLGYMKLSERSRLLPFINEIKRDPDFVVEFGPSDYTGFLIKNSRFCLFVYDGEMTWMVEALSSGCVPVVITDRPIQDLPLMDVIDWSEVAVFVGSNGGANGLKQVLDGINNERYDQMGESGAAATQHLLWNTDPQSHDAFHLVIYQLWLRRHTIRYARRAWA